MELSHVNTVGRDELVAEIQRLGPWHLLVDVCDGVDTNTGNQQNQDGRKVSLVNGKDNFSRLMSKIYPEGLSGKSFFDNACNCGGYSFWAKELGAEKTFGYDVREHWIKQAEFLRKNRSFDTSGMEFKIADLYDIPKLDLPKFDITWFSGILYHLPDPITGLKIAADMTNEVIYLNTAIMTVTEEELGSGSLYLSIEGTEHLMTGVHRLNWYPSGPLVLKKLLNWLGFPEVRVVFWKKRVSKDARPEQLRSNVGRVALVGARQAGMLKGLRDALPVEQVEHQWTPRSDGSP
jgi:SAM-dependent methyltransferase